MDDNKDLSAFAAIRTAANHVRSSMLSGYIRTIARAITVLAGRPVSGKPGNVMPAPTKTDDGKMLVPSRRINDLIWKRISSKAS
jgi:hypothetical protein